VINFHRIHADVLQLRVEPLNFTHVLGDLQIQLINQVPHLFKEPLRISLELLKLGVRAVGAALATLRESNAIPQLLNLVEKALLIGVALLLIESQVLHLCLQVANLPFKLLRRLPLAIEFLADCIGKRAQGLLQIANLTL
jgi:hypothetical protein